MTSKSFFSIFVAMALVPMVLAFVVLKMGWFTPGATNKGEFVQQELVVELPNKNPTWSLIYQPDSNDCAQKCQEQIYALNQTYLALGKLQKRVSGYVLAKEWPLPQNSLLKVVDDSSPELSIDFVYLVDPFGKVILRYPGSTERQQTLKTSKDMLADIKKLLNYARVG